MSALSIDEFAAILRAEGTDGLDADDDHATAETPPETGLEKGAGRGEEDADAGAESEHGRDGGHHRSLSALDNPDYLDFIPSIPSNKEWVGGAVCPSVDPELFFPAKGESSKPAKSVCAGCPVRRPCLAWALAVEQVIGPMPGIYGGKTKKERMPEAGVVRQCRWYDCTADRKSVYAIYCEQHAVEAKKRTQIASDRRRRARQRDQRRAPSAAA